MSLSSSGAKSGKKPSAKLLVDGYNMIGAWPFLREVRDRHGLEMARHDLIESLSGYATFQGFDTEIVFDAQYSRSVRLQESVTQYLRVYYTDYNQTADTYIEKVCAQVHNQIDRRNWRVIVATSDRAQQLTVVGYGAEWISANQLLSDMEFSRRNLKHKLRSAQKPKRKLLSNTLDPVIKQKLAQMRSTPQGRKLV